MPMPPFDLDDVTNLVQHEGIAARLSEQEKRLLVLLAGREGTAFGKRALMEALWGTRAEWMEDAVLVQLVSRLRRSLAPLGLQRAIVTVARVGYRFDAPAASTPLPVDGDVDRCAVTVRDAAPASAGAPRLHHDVARDGHGEVQRDGVIVRIPHLEYRLLCALRTPIGVAHDKRTLIALLWPSRPDQDDTNLMQVVSRLRRKLIPVDLHRHIVTVPGVGYRFEPLTCGGRAAAPDLSTGRPPHAPLSPAGSPVARWLTHLLPVRGALTRLLRWRAR